RIRRVVSALDSNRANTQAPEITVRLLSSFTLESIEPALRLGLWNIPACPRLDYAPLNTIEQELLDPNSETYKGSQIANVILWRIDELLPAVYWPYSSPDLSAQVEELLGRIRRMVQAYVKHGSAPLFISTIPMPMAFNNRVLDNQMAAGMAATI